MIFLWRAVSLLGPITKMFSFFYFPVEFSDVILLVKQSEGRLACIPLMLSPILFCSSFSSSAEPHILGKVAAKIILMS